MISPVLPSYARAPLSFVKGEGAWLVEADGRRFLDFGSGIAVMALGHGHPAVVAALKDQADALWHTSNLYRVPNQEALAERMAAVPINQLAMQKLVINQAIEATGIFNTQRLATLFDGISRHSPEGINFKTRSEDVGWKQAVNERDRGTYDWTQDRPLNKPL